MTDGDLALGQHELSTDNRGVEAGVNFAASDSTDLGLALSWNTADFALSNGFGSGASDTIFVALRARTSSDRAYVEGALAYGRSDITTDRTVTIAGVDRFTADTTAETIAAHIEAGYHMGRITSFVGLRAQSFSTPAYEETTVAGSSSFALRHDAYTAQSVRSELGVAMEWTSDRFGRDAAAFGVRASWQHEFASNDPSIRSFIAVPGVSFPVSGATRDRDSLVLSANATLAARNGISVGASVDTEFSRNAQDFGGSLSVSYRW